MTSRKMNWVLFCVGIAILAVGLYAGASIYLIYIANLLLTYAVLAIGLDVLLGRAGQFAFAHIAFYGIGIYTTAILTNNTELPFFIGILAGGILAGLIGVLIAIPATRLRDVYLALATFAFAEAAQWLFNNWDSVTNGPNGLRITPAKLFGFKITNDQDAFPAVLAIALAVMVATVWVARSHLGRKMRAIRDSEHVALASGVNVQRVKVIAFAISAVYAGIAGGMFTLFQSHIHPDSLGFELIVLVLTMVVVGGLGHLPGVILGVLLLGLMPEILRELREWQEVIYGLILIATVIFMPRGIWGAILAIRDKRQSRSPNSGPVREHSS